MAIKRLWFINAPIGTIDVLQRSQIAIGWPFGAGAPLPVPEDYTDYLRRYLDDPIVTDVNTVLPTYSVLDSEYLAYLRRYLGD